MITPYFNKTAFSLLLLCMLLIPVPAPATSVLSVTFHELVESSELVFEGTAVATENRESNFPRTCIRFEISDILKGEYPSDTIELCFLGGTHGELILNVSEMQYPEPGEKGIYFVESLSSDQANPLLGWNQGHFIILKDPDTTDEHMVTSGRKAITEISEDSGRRRSLSTGVPSNVKTAERSPGQKGMTAGEFKKKIRSMLEGR